MSSKEKMQAIQTRITDLDSEIAELNRQREGHALDYSQNNKNAVKAVAALDGQMDAARREKGLLETALDQLKSLAQEEQQAILDQVELQRQSKAAELAASIIDTNNAIDSKLRELCSLLKLRADNLNALRQLAVIDPMYVSRMGRSTVTAAFAAAGLNKFIAMDTPAPSGIRTLADASNHFLAGIGKSPPVAERVKEEAS